MGFEVNKVALGQVFSEYFCFPCQFSSHRLLHTHHLSSGAGTIGQLVAYVPRGLSLTSAHEVLKILDLYLFNVHDVSEMIPQKHISTCNLGFTEQVDLQAVSRNYIQEVFVSNLSRHTVYLHWDISWFFSVIPDKFRDCTSIRPRPRPF
jgi:hypothetical protein